MRIVVEHFFRTVQNTKKKINGQMRRHSHVKICEGEYILLQYRLTDSPCVEVVGIASSQPINWYFFTRQY
jgi:hypothetical protein